MGMNAGVYRASVMDMVRGIYVVIIMGIAR
jgi:hypothetical protein